LSKHRHQIIEFAPVRLRAIKTDNTRQVNYNRPNGRSILHLLLNLIRNVLIPRDPLFSEKLERQGVLGR